MKIALLLAFCLAALRAADPSARAAITLADGGKSDYVIVASESASPSEKHAASELQTFLKEISGAELPIVAGPTDPGRKMIVVGDGEVLRSLGVGLDLARLGDEGFAIKTSGQHLIIAGGRLRGTMYGVYTFLEDVLGCRWYTPGASCIPKKPTIKLDELDITQTPDFEYREPYFLESDDPDWAARNRVNGNSMKLDEARGGKVSYGRFCHTFDEIAPVDKYLKDHPEYYSLIKGERVGGQYKGQLCLANPDVVKLAVDAVLKWIADNPSATIFSVTQNDNGWHCECDKCKAIDEEEGSPSGLMLRFVNAVADEVAKKHPDKLIDTFAYWYTEAPPKITKPRPNVRVRLCPISCCNHHDYERCEKNAAFMERFRGWDSITDTLYIWHYACNFRHYLLPFPDLDQLVTSVRMYKRCGVRGVFVQGMEPGGRVFMHNLKAYLTAKLLWNSKADPKAIIKDFLNGYYGKAGKPIGELLDLLHETVRSKNIHGGVFDGLDRDLAFDPQGKQTLYLTPEIMPRAWELINQAEDLADNAEIFERVGEVRLSLECVNALRRAQTAAASTAKQKVLALNALEKLVAHCKRYGMEYWAAGGVTLQMRFDELAAPLRK